MKGTPRRAFRRTALVTVGVAATFATTLALTAPGQAAPSAGEAFGPGTGSATALAYKVNPIFGNLSFGITAGESVAGHQNTGATAQSKAVNLGVIGVTLAGEGCKGAAPTLAAEDQPQPVIVTSDEPNADQGVTKTLLDLPAGITMTSRATKAPFAEATTTVAPLGDKAGAYISGGTATATSGIVKPGVRQARAVTDIGEIDLLGGLITLKGLHWEAVQETGGATTNQGTFTMGSIHLAGTAIPLPADPLEQLTVLRDTLRALGLTIDPPTVRVEKGIVFVDPLRIGIVPSTLRDTIVGGLLGALAPVRTAFTDLLAQIGCEGETNILGNNGKTAVTVLDLALGAISGAGALTLEVGGVQATTADINAFSFGGGNGSLTALPDLGGDSSALPDLGSGADLPTLPDATAGSGSGGRGTPVTPTSSTDDDDGQRGGTLLGLGAGGLLLMLLTAEADRRKMRRAQRAIPLEA
jgi:hypothetical protein